MILRCLEIYCQSEYPSLLTTGYNLALLRLVLIQTCLTGLSVSSRSLKCFCLPESSVIIACKGMRKGVESVADYYLFDITLQIQVKSECVCSFFVQTFADVLLNGPTSVIKLVNKCFNS